MITDASRKIDNNMYKYSKHVVVWPHIKMEKNIQVKHIIETSLDNFSEKLRQDKKSDDITLIRKLVDMSVYKSLQFMRVPHCYKKYVVLSSHTLDKNFMLLSNISRKSKLREINNIIENIGSYNKKDLIRTMLVQNTNQDDQVFTIDYVE